MISLERSNYSTRENSGNYKRGAIMKSKTLALATLLLVTAFLLTQAIAPHTALADASWTDTGGGMSSYGIQRLAYDSTNNVLYAGTNTNGVWKYDGTSWTNTGGAVSSYGVPSLAYDSGHNLLYAGCYGDTFLFRFPAFN